MYAYTMLRDNSLKVAPLSMQLQAERDGIEKQFKQLYHDKYQPLKMSHQAALDSNKQLQEQQQQALEKLRTQLATADLKVRRAGLDVQSLTQQLQQSQEALQVRHFFHCTHLIYVLANQEQVLLQQNAVLLLGCCLHCYSDSLVADTNQTGFTCRVVLILLQNWLAVCKALMSTCVRVACSANNNLITLAQLI